MQTKEYYQKVVELSASNQPLWQACIIHTDGSSPARIGMKLLIPLLGAIYGNLGGGELEHKIIEFVREQRPAQPQQLSFDLGSGELGNSKETSMICGGSATVFIEALYNPNQLFIIGAGHCGKALGHLAKLCGFWVHLVDNRQDILDASSEESFQMRQLNDFSAISQALSFGPHAWIVIMTHGHLHDKEVLQQCLNQDFRYLGMIGSRHKVSETFDLLRKQGYSDDLLQKVHAPIGLPIGSQQPYEIAISIMAELIRELRLKEQ
ncbi:MAG: XdhC/CoxI family protein [Candidatus Cloacimonetes bacterium]|jgi:xanthine dehydrogenase accessory factor|nr:XdhC/CoxI family protein [Candidatus Cloacimonadota bacterium]